MSHSPKKQTLVFAFHQHQNNIQYTGTIYISVRDNDIPSQTKTTDKTNTFTCCRGSEATHASQSSFRSLPSGLPHHIQRVQSRTFVVGQQPRLVLRDEKRTLEWIAHKGSGGGSKGVIGIRGRSRRRGHRVRASTTSM